MWINEIFFDGDHVRGYLINEPTALRTSMGDYVEIPLSNISDWLFAITPVYKTQGTFQAIFIIIFSTSKTYGGFTIQNAC